MHCKSSIDRDEVYQDLLDRVYDGKVTAKEFYINRKAILLHHCDICGQDFYHRPAHVLNPFKRHNCIDKPQTNHSPNLSTEKKEEIVRLGQVGMSVSAIARLLNIKPSTVRYQFKKHGIMPNTSKTKKGKC